jgi:hypothetical protein
MARTPAPVVTAIRYVHAVTGETTYDVASTGEGVQAIVRNLESNGHTKIAPVSVELLYRGKVREVTCTVCGTSGPLITRVIGILKCVDCW